MLFIAYSKKDRKHLVNPILFHLKQMGVNVWYDFYEMFLGDDRLEANFDKGLACCHYTLFLITPNLFQSNCAREELEYAQVLYENKKLVVFPAFYNYSPEELALEYTWMKNIIYNEITKRSGTCYLANQIIERILNDKIERLAHTSILSFLNTSLYNQPFLKEMIFCVKETFEDNYKVKIGLLYGVYVHCTLEQQLETDPDINLHQAITKIFEMTKNNVKIDHLIYSIFEKCLIIVLNQELLDGLNDVK